MPTWHLNNYCPKSYLCLVLILLYMYSISVAVDCNGAQVKSYTINILPETSETCPNKGGSQLKTTDTAAAAEIVELQAAVAALNDTLVTLQTEAIPNITSRAILASAAAAVGATADVHGKLLDEINSTLTTRNQELSEEQSKAAVTGDQLSASIAVLNATLAQLTARLDDDIDTLNRSNGELRDELQRQVANAVASAVASAASQAAVLTYERWGRTTCPAATGATLLYAGKTPTKRQHARNTYVVINLSSYMYLHLASTRAHCRQCTCSLSEKLSSYVQH